jgi:NAD+ synthase (glutamine-hydrolysing)
MTSLVTVATCNLDQWALDFDGNLKRVRDSIIAAKKAGAKYRVGPELELCGYGCEDHFLEMDTFTHCWESLASLLSDDTTSGILCDIGMPVLHRGVRYNCRVFCLNGKILLIRPKLCLADDGNYRESRYFTAWHADLHAAAPRELETHQLPRAFVEATKGVQTAAPFGIAILKTIDGVTIASETCEELFTPLSPNIALALSGVDIISNGSGSHHQLRKLHTRVDLMRGAGSRGGGVYLYANQQGCDGGRLYFDGCALILMNGDCVGQGDQFSLRDVEVVTATVDLDDVRSARAANASRNVQAAAQPALPTVGPIDISFAGDAPKLTPAEQADKLEGVKMTPSVPHIRFPSKPRAVRYLLPEDEIALGPACWLWDFLRRSGASGYFLALSGGADSAATCAIVGVMTQLLFKEIVIEKNPCVLADLRRVIRDREGKFMPTSPQEIANLLLHTCYMGTSNSTAETRDRAALIARDIGAYHLHALIDTMVAAILGVFAVLFGVTSFFGDKKGSDSSTNSSNDSLTMPRFLSQGGTHAEDLALQNIQARLRMVLAYFLAQLLPWVRSKTDRKGGLPGGSGGGFLLVLGSANVDEALRGYMTKYDCSSADLNPIGAVAKGDLKRFLIHASRPLHPTLGHQGVGMALGPYAPGSEPTVASTLTTLHGYGYSSLMKVVEAQPTAELRPVELDPTTGLPVKMQLDEEDMGMSYEELGWFGRLRKNARCGPYSMYLKLKAEWGIAEEGTGPAPAATAGSGAANAARGLTARVIGEKVKRFFTFYGRNRHKMTTLTPSYHAESYSPDDNRYDLRPFLYPSDWKRQFDSIDKDVEKEEQEEMKKEAGRR